MADVSPTKWHRGHTTWFFEAFLLNPYLVGYRRFHVAFDYLFNSYYEEVGQRHPRSERGNLSRPSCEEVAAYRAYADEAMDRLLAQPLDGDIIDPVTLGLHHEQQHQELLLMDIKHVLSTNQALWPAYSGQWIADGISSANHDQVMWVDYEGGEVWLGHSGDGFAYDNEGPCHRTFLMPYQLATQLITNGEWLQFMADGGYRTPTLWLSDGWHLVQEMGWRCPFYWYRQDDQWFEFTLAGLQPVILHEPVCHLSYYEADAFARWADARLPTEAEWEYAAGNVAGSENPLQELFGRRWQWTSSPYCAYPGFRSAPGAVGEYNGKFMSNQFVLRGGSCATSQGHIRATYRNFFHPHTRWHFSGVRLARDAS